MAGFDLTLIGLKLDGNAIQRVLGEPAAGVYMNGIAETIAHEVVKILPRSNKDQAHAQDNVRWRATKLADVYHGSVLVDVPHATYLHEGTRPHSIDAKNVRNLAFFWPKAGRMFIGPHVNHPGTRGFPFFEHACLDLGLAYHPRAG